MYLGGGVVLRGHVPGGGISCESSNRAKHSKEALEVKENCLVLQSETC